MPTPPATGGAAGGVATPGGAPPAAGAAGAAGGTAPIAGAAGAPGGAPAGGTVTGPDGKMFATDPVIPEAAGECPSFDSGSATIMGANVTFLAQKKAESGGYLVFYWHGTGSSPVEGNGSFAGLNDVMTNGGLVVGFSSHASGGDCSGTGTHSIGDFEVADQIVACGVKNFGIDPKRIYATGCSAGGLQTGCMGINRSGYMAAVVPNSGGATVGYGPFQDLTRVPATMTMHGAPGGDVVIVDFSETSEGYDNFMLAKGGFVVNCNHGGSHCGASSGLQASAWQFMQDHPFGSHPDPYAAGLPSGFDDSCKIFDTPTGVTLLGGDGSGGMRPPMMP